LGDFYECAIGSFDDEVEALVQYGHDCCARIDDRIHECCERIKDAHNVEVDAYKIALGWKREQSTHVAYDVLGNERHKALCELRKMSVSYPEYSGSPFAKWYSDLSAALGIDSSDLSFGEVRDKLIHLLGGDQTPASLSDLYGMWKEEQDAMDSTGCVPARDGGPDAAPVGHTADNSVDSMAEGLKPVTGDLRSYMEAYKPSETDGQMVVSRIGTIGYEGFLMKCDAIDAIHASLERENEELRQRTMYPAESERINMLEREVKRLTSECKTQRNNFDQATSAREHWKSLYEQALEHIHDLERDYEVACHVNEKQERECLEWYNNACNMQKEIDDLKAKNGDMWLKGYHECHAELMDGNATLVADLERAGWMMLPKDSYGEPVHVGDVVEWCDSGDAIDVIGIGTNDTLFYVDPDGDGEQAEWTTARNKRVRHKPTVEDVLYESLKHFGAVEERTPEVEEWLHEQAAKLQLRGDAK